MLTLTSDPADSSWALAFSQPAVLDKPAPFLKRLSQGFTRRVVILWTLAGKTTLTESRYRWANQSLPPCGGWWVNKYVIGLKMFKQHREKRARHTTKGKHIRTVSCQNTQRKHFILTIFLIKSHGRPRQTKRMNLVYPTVGYRGLAASGK